MKITNSMFCLVVLSMAVTATVAEDNVPFVDMIPVVSQLKSIVQYITGDKNGAMRTAVNYHEDGIGTSQMRSLYKVLGGEYQEAIRIQERFVDNVKRGVVDPLVSTAKSVSDVMNGAVQFAAIDDGGFMGINYGPGTIKDSTTEPDDDDNLV